MGHDQWSDVLLPVRPRREAGGDDDQSPSLLCGDLGVRNVRFRRAATGDGGVWPSARPVDVLDDGGERVLWGKDGEVVGEGGGDGSVGWCAGEWGWGEVCVLPVWGGERVECGWEGEVRDVCEGFG